MPTKNAQNPPPPELSKGLDIRIISAAPFAQIIQKGAQAYQLHVSPSLLEGHLWADANIPTPETKLEEQILHKVAPLHIPQINLEEGMLPPFGKIYNMLEVELCMLKDYLDNMLGKGFI
ncbi:hypothetical protein C0995_002833 [Termitomyces sp. Mi166|nr:hypothetical protein C0995_002833 [Termitomyces sp. Mi166\